MSIAIDRSTVPRRLTEISKEDWVNWVWVEVTAYSDYDQMFLRTSYPRTPEERLAAAITLDGLRERGLRAGLADA